MRRAASLLVVALVLVLSACGGDDGGETAPAIPTAAAEDLAAQADAIAASYESGDVCAAAKQADSLSAAVDEAIGAGEVPPELQESIQATAIELVNEINCPAPAPTAEEQPTTEEPPVTETQPVTDEQPTDDCAQLEDERQSLEDEIASAEPKGRLKQLEDELEALDALITAVCGGSGQEGES